MPDNQASANIMSLDFAWREGIRVDPVRVPFVLGDGSIHYSVGRAIVDCALPVDPDCPRLHEFYVLFSPTAPLILGRKFLHEAHITRLPSANATSPVATDDDHVSIRTSISLDHIEYSTWHVKATLRHEEVVEESSIVPDQGSDINCMSLKYARDINVGIKPCQKIRDTLVCLADGRSASVMGFADVFIQFSGTATRQLGQIPVRFAIIENLPFHLILGNPAIKKFKILEDTSFFEWVRVVDQYATLCPLTERKPKGKCISRRPNSRELSLSPTPHAVSLPSYEQLITISQGPRQVEPDERRDQTDATSRAVMQRQRNNYAAILAIVLAESQPSQVTSAHASSTSLGDEGPLGRRGKIFSGFMFLGLRLPDGVPPNLSSLTQESRHTSAQRCRCRSSRLS